MRIWLTVFLLTLLWSDAFAKKPVDAPFPTQFEIGRHTFIDVGPPNDYYEIIVVRPASAGSSVERLLLTPAAGCFQPAKTEEAVSKWTFPAEAAGQEIEVVLEFNTNCPKDTK